MTLIERVAEGILCSVTADGRLSSVRELARVLRTSTATVLKALNRLLREGAVIADGTVRRRYYIGSSDMKFPPQRKCTVPVTRCQRLADELRRLRLRDELTPNGRNPSQRELMRRFGVGYSVLQDALTILRKEGIPITSKDPTVESDTSVHARRDSHIYLLSAPAVFKDPTTQTMVLTTTLESEFERRGWGELRHIVTWNPENLKPCRPEQASGFIHVMGSYSDGWVEFIRRSPGIPTAIIDTTAYSMINRLPTGSFTVTTTNRDAGRSVARSLYGLGHRRIAFFSHLPADISWVRERIEGIVDAFGTAECPTESSGVSVFSPDASPVTSANRAVSRTAHQLNKLLMGKRFLPEDLISQSLGPLYQLDDIVSGMQGFLPMFRKALADQSITAWVCVNDSLASIAAHTLADNGIEIGKGISLCGFDNSLLSYRMQISSYDFAFARVARTVVGFLERPKVLKRADSRLSIVEGHVVLRDSVCQARLRQGREIK